MGFLLLEDGTLLEGISFGAEGESIGEVVFNTSMVGYPESITDPSYSGQILVFTYPLIGNYGIQLEDRESEVPLLRGIVVREYCEIPSHWGIDYDIDSFLKEFGIVGLSGIDTRALTRKLRIFGTLRGVISSGEFSQERKEELMDKILNWHIEDFDFVKSSCVKDPVYLGEGGERIVLIDCGVKQGIVRSLLSLGFQVVVVPAWYTKDDVLSFDPDGVLISNGPGDPKRLTYVVETVKGLIEEEIPLFGICLGHQIIGLALGSTTYKLKFGHRGANQPVKNLITGKVYITSQNHSYVVDPKGLPEDIKVSFINLNDKTVEGLKSTKRPIMSVQFHPEASPGPLDTKFLFEEFAKECMRKTYAT
ncbi:MAG: glutamine-hydrolyzing carbamoyl-phosphate synthase small subunit [bacterium]